MRTVIQRVSSARVDVNGDTSGAIDSGLLVFIAVEKGDPETACATMARKVAGLRIFPDESGRMNRSVKDIGGEVLAVSQFTLAADMKKGYRPSFGNAEKPERAERLYNTFCSQLNSVENVPVQRGVFGADMKVHLINDGPVTIRIDLPVEAKQ
ncbi:MAG: D-tyrosyl-tRNA(Tyr) deacylase [Magnetococcales bacterium]|nr:D-tyrosyl-tRNA(Tyr) deacylase [Magnetococcales bacterium]